VALRVAEVVVVVVGAVVGLGGSCVVVVVGEEGTDDGPGGGVVVELDVGDELVPPEAPPAWVAAGREEVAGFRVVETPGREPSVSDADLVWKARTPASPAMVAPITIGARLIELASCALTWDFASSVT